MHTTTNQMRPVSVESSPLAVSPVAVETPPPRIPASETVDRMEREEAAWQSRPKVQTGEELRREYYAQRKSENTPPPCPGLPVEKENGMPEISITSGKLTATARKYLPRFMRMIKGVHCVGGKIGRTSFSLSTEDHVDFRLIYGAALCDGVTVLFRVESAPPPLATSKAEKAPSPVSAAEFAKSHACDADWIAAMRSNMIVPWRRGDAVKYGEFDGTVIRHYRNGMFEVMMPGGVACVGFDPITPPPYMPVLETKKEHAKAAAELVRVAKESAPMSMEQAAEVYQSALKSPPSEENPRRRHSRRAPRHRFTPAAWRGHYLACYTRPRVKPAPSVRVY